MLKPSCLIAVRWTSTTRTLSITWSWPVMASMLSTCSGLSTNWTAICWALSASAALCTWPVRISELLTACTCTWALGSTRAMVAATAEVSWSTRISSRRIGWPMPSKNTASVSPLARPSTEMRRGVRSTTSAMAGLVTEMSRASMGSSTMADLPLPSDRVRAAGPWPVISMRTTPGSAGGGAAAKTAARRPPASLGPAPACGARLMATRALRKMRKRADLISRPPG